MPSSSHQFSIVFRMLDIMRVVDGEEFALHNSKESCWLAIHGRVWDVTAFVDNHPGGAAMILNLAGRDASEEYNEVHAPELVEDTLGKKALIGKVDASNIPENKSKSSRIRGEPERPSLGTVLNLYDFEKIAKATLKPTTWAYVSSGADDEISKTENARAYQKVFLRARILRNVGQVDCSTSILGHKVTLPIYGSPVGLAKLVHPEGECAIAKALGKEGLVQVVNTVSSIPIEDIMAARLNKDQPVFWQLYVDKDLRKSEAFVKRVEKAGVKAIWLTVDSPVVGKREEDERSKPQVQISESIDTATSSGSIAKAATGFINASIDWDIINWLRDITNLPLVIKGIQCVEDAVLAFDSGVQAIVLSNHGGRSQDTAQPPLITLLEINKFAPHILHKHMEVYIDGGIRRGTDVLKAIALGATAVGLGRPMLHSMSAGYGENGIRRMIQILRDELQTNMAFVGAQNVRALTREMLNTRKLEKLVTGSLKL